MGVESVKTRDSYGVKLEEIKTAIVSVQVDIDRVKADLVVIKKNTDKEIG